MEQIKIFLSYSHDDEKLQIELDKHLAPLKHNENIITWYDRKIIAGQELDEEIKRELNESDIILLLISSSFLSSYYCYEIEMAKALERHKTKQTIVVPILLRDCLWDKEPFSNILMGTDDAIAIDNPKNLSKDLAFTKVAKNLEGTIALVRQRKSLISSRKESLDSPANLAISLVNDYPKPTSLFTGRESEMREFSRVFENFRLFAIEGIGGTGKTQFVAKCIENIIPRKDNIIWLNGASESNFDVFIESSGYGEVLKGKDKSDSSVYAGFRDLIERDEKIIFWDNFHDYTDNAFRDFLSFASQYLRKSTIILLTKTEPLVKNINNIPSIKLEGLKKDALEYAKKLRSTSGRFSSISDSDLQKICTNVDGHPLAVELSLQLLSYGQTVNDIEQHIAEYKGIKWVEDFSKRLFEDIFYHSNTTAEERECFLKFSVYKERVKEEAIKYLYDGRSIFNLLIGLQDKLLLSYKDGCYETHPLIRSFCYEMLLDKPRVHEKAANYYISNRGELLNFPLEEKILYHLSASNNWEEVSRFIEKNGTILIRQGQLSLLFEFIEKLLIAGIHAPLFDLLCGDIYQIKGEWNKALNYFDKVKQSNEDNCIKAEGIVKYGEILFRMAKAKDSLTYFERGYELSRSIKCRKEEALALNDIGLAYQYLGDYKIADSKYQEARRIQEEIMDEGNLADTLINIGHVFSNLTEYKEALIMFRQCLSLKEKIGDKSGICNALLSIGTIYRNLNKPKDSMEYFLKGMSLAEKIGDKQIIAGAFNHIGTGGTLDARNGNLNYFEKALEINREIGNKSGTISVLNNIANLFCSKGEIDKGMGILNDSLKLAEEIEDKACISTICANIGYFSTFKGKKDYSTALFYSLKALAISVQSGFKRNIQAYVTTIDGIEKSIGLKEFRVMVVAAYGQLSNELKEFINLNQFLKEPVRSEKKIGRNDPCPCGNGKKYKQCHGKQ